MYKTLYFFLVTAGYRPTQGKLDEVVLQTYIWNSAVDYSSILYGTDV